MVDYYELVDSYQDEDGTLIDVYEHPETGDQFEKRVGVDEE